MHGESKRIAVFRIAGFPACPICSVAYFIDLSLKILVGLFRTNSYWQKSTSLKNINDILLVASTGASMAGESLGCCQAQEAKPGCQLPQHLLF